MKKEEAIVTLEIMKDNILEPVSGLMRKFEDAITEGIKALDESMETEWHYDLPEKSGYYLCICDTDKNNRIRIMEYKPINRPERNLWNDNGLYVINGFVKAWRLPDAVELGELK